MTELRDRFRRAIEDRVKTHAMYRRGEYKGSRREIKAADKVLSEFIVNNISALLDEMDGKPKKADPKAIEVIVAWLTEVLVPDETSLMRKGAGSLIADLKAAGLTIGPVEPTEAMWTAGREPILCAESIGFAWSVSQHCGQAFEKIPAWAEGLENMTHLSKGDLAVAVYKAMIKEAQ